MTGDSKSPKRQAVVVTEDELGIADLVDGMTPEELEKIREERNANKTRDKIVDRLKAIPSNPGQKGPEDWPLSRGEKKWSRHHHSKNNHDKGAA